MLNQIHLLLQFFKGLELDTQCSEPNTVFLKILRRSGTEYHAPGTEYHALGTEYASVIKNVSTQIRRRPSALFFSSEHERICISLLSKPHEQLNLFMRTQSKRFVISVSDGTTRSVR
ncbi:uncharacterized protein HKW66_Vig0043840 [Vigna angularis]|uniref:Uncharacterized protein n=2 Tax=Phaseolus angularis TaxID=3914 RepID=A0A8T0L095_PHAAN|nr:uncharacterized protein HKW66_Vig0043840 [Vigna angularis]BAT84685.1 hypothetical protein VIGAN_04212200 [Vigna angularis var. angularis]